MRGRSRLPSWVCALLLCGLGAVVCLPGSAQEVCAVPGTVTPSPPRPVDHANPNAPADYMALVLSWSPEHCESQRNKTGAAKDRHAFQCFSGNRFEWVVHGLWPQNGRARSVEDHPRNCQPTPSALSAPLLRQYLCMMPGTDLMQNEWQAHGTCGWASADRYFADIQRVYGALRRPTTAQMVPGGASAKPNQLLDARAADVKQAFLALNPELRAENLRVNVASGNRLKELWICLDKAMKLMGCPSGGMPDRQQIRIRATQQ